MVGPTDDPRWPETIRLLELKSAAYWQATPIGNQLLKEFSSQLEGFLGYSPVFFHRDSKKWSRICEKAASVLSENVNFSAAEAADDIRDIAGGRILVIGLHDLDLAKTHLAGYVDYNRLDVRLWEFQDNVQTPRPGGFRSLNGGAFLDKMGGFPFELQLMTPLQHAWDKLQHPVYEKARSRGLEVPTDVQEWFENLSRRFYDLDREISTKQQQYRASGLL